MYLLPAFPDAWETGSIQGICACGDFELSMIWKNKTFAKVNIFA
ncbi:MAG: glycoside hydrolase family 95-like protein [Bacteroidota bacterium]